jgi:hypothetical protein
MSMLSTKAAASVTFETVMMTESLAVGLAGTVVIAPIAGGVVSPGTPALHSPGPHVAKVTIDPTKRLAASPKGPNIGISTSERANVEEAGAALELVEAPG